MVSHHVSTARVLSIYSFYINRPKIARINIPKSASSKEIHGRKAFCFRLQNLLLFNSQVQSLQGLIVRIRAIANALQLQP